MVNLFIEIVGVENRITNDENFATMTVEVFTGGINSVVYPEVAPFPEDGTSTFTTMSEALNYFGDYNWRVIDQETETRGKKILHRYIINKEV